MFLYLKYEIKSKIYILAITCNLSKSFLIFNDLLLFHTIYYLNLFIIINLLKIWISGAHHKTIFSK